MEKTAVFNNSCFPICCWLPQLINYIRIFLLGRPARRLAIVPARDAFGLSSEFIGLENYQALFAHRILQGNADDSGVLDAGRASSLAIALLFATQADKT